MSTLGPAGAADPLLGVRIEQAVVEGDLDAAIALLETARADETDPRTIRDLLSRLAELQELKGDRAAAARARAGLAAQIGASAGQTAPELVPVLRALASDQRALGDLAAAVATLEQALAIARTAALAEAIPPLLRELAAIAEAANDSAVAEAANRVVASHEESARRLEETSRAFDPDPEKEFTRVKIYYATDRARSGSAVPNEFYGGQRGELELGTATVSIPEQHRPGQIEKPSWWTFQFREDPERHVVLQSVTPGSPETVFGEMRQQATASGSPEAFVFVHGFNVPFHEAAQRTAQMAYDMNFDGLPVLYSWPSRASVMSYIADTAVVNLSGRRLSRFLEDLVAKSGATRIHLIAHSMGNRAMTDALELFALRYRGKNPAFDQVLFTAPDLDAGLFAEMMKTIRPIANRITLYASNKDWALAVSRQLHGDAPRAGQGGRSILHTAEVDSIDMTGIGEDMLKHSYYANNPSALTDILSLFWRDAPPDKRCGMQEAEGENGSYWIYSPAACGDDNVLLSTLSYLRRGSVASVKDARLFLNRFIMPATADPEERSKLEKALGKLFGN
ncbi:alpha/beta hydrolase [Nitratireductor sp. CAU 1489]|uniref:Alpha/beta hydrolase n=1 Tax=Nitratireductor arenosus TaxID=2682096 RepID=A0A844QFD4_9HYPH|nr:alpha/beta hydrolase [Nitratireductor arenosus]